MIDHVEEIIMRVIRSASLAPLKSKSICVIGYGSQGRAQALNLRDAGFSPTIGLPRKSKSAARARRDGFAVRTAADACREANVVFVLAPDHLHAKIYKDNIEQNISPGTMLVFAHGSSIHFGLITPSPDVEVVLIAPLGPGKRLRELRGQRSGVACFFAMHHNTSKKTRALALALAKAIGCIPAGAVETTFAAEAVGDLFGEQAVLCGGLSELLQAGVETLVRHGATPANAYLECVYQLDLIVDLIKSEGLRGMYSQISPTAAFGAVYAGPKVISASTRRAMDSLYTGIESGEFIRRWMRVSRDPKSRLPKIARAFERGESEVVNALSKP
jgi:ketol-acid reductoisomerase